MEEGEKNLDVFLSFTAFSPVAGCSHCHPGWLKLQQKASTPGGPISGQPQPLESEKGIPESIESERKTLRFCVKALPRSLADS